jgi:hypothetical protein
MTGLSAGRRLAACAVCLSAWCIALSGAFAQAPPYLILLRSRDAVVTPARGKDGQTGGGFIQVTQIQPNAVMVLMRGAVAAGTGHHDGSAAMRFALTQDFEIVASRSDARPPRLVVAAWLIGALESSLRNGGSAEHGPALASIRAADQPILNLAIKPHGVGGGENLLVNDRVGPLEQVVTPGGYCLNQTFAINAVQGPTHCHNGGAAAVFDPDPKLDALWNEILKPFRAVPPRDFGFRVILRVVEDPPPLVSELPPPRPEGDELPPPKEEK